MSKIIREGCFSDGCWSLLALLFSPVESLPIPLPHFALFFSTIRLIL